MKRMRFLKINLCRWQAQLKKLNRSTKRGLILAFCTFFCALIGHFGLFHEPVSAALNPDLALLNRFNIVQNSSPPGDPVDYELIFRNSTTNPVTITSLNHTLPAPSPTSTGYLIFFDTTPKSNSCGSTVVITPGVAGSVSGIVAITGGTIPASGDEPGECSILLQVQGFTEGNHIATISEGSLSTNIGENEDGGTAATLSIEAAVPATIEKSLSANTIPGDGRSTVTLTINNSNDYDLTGTTATPTLTDDLPSSPFQLIVDERDGAAVGLNTTCTGGTVEIKAGGTGIELIGGIIPRNSSCEITFPVTQVNGGTYNNTIPAGALNTRNLISNSNSATANLSVQTEVSIAKSFGDGGREEGETTTLDITITNGGGALTNVELTDLLPAPLVIADTNASTTCTSSGNSEALSVSTTSPANESFTLISTNVVSNAEVPGSNAVDNTLGSCTISVNVKVDPERPNPDQDSPDFFNISDSPSNASRRITNTIPIDALQNTEDRSNSAEASDTFIVRPALVASKGYSNGNTIARDGTTRMMIAIANRSNGIDATGVAFTDNLPTPLQVADPPNASTSSGCGSPTFTPSAGETSLSFSDGTISRPSGGGSTVCTIQVDLFLPSGSTENSFDNIIDNDSISTNERLDSDGVTGNEGRLFVADDVEIVKAFDANSVRRGVPSRLIIEIENNRRTESPLGSGSPLPLTGVTISDVLPNNLQVTNFSSSFSSNGCSLSSTPTFTTTSGGTFSDGSTSFRMTGGSIAPVDDAGGEPNICTIQFDVTEIDTSNDTFPPPQIYNNTTSNFGNNENITATEASDTLTITSPLEGTKTFQSDRVVAGGKSTAVIELTNTLPQDLTVTNFDDVWPQDNVFVADPPNATTTCSDGTVTTNPATKRVEFRNGTIPAQVGGTPGRCVVQFEVEMGAGSSTFNNTLSAETISTFQGFTNPADITGRLTQTTANVSLNKTFSPNRVIVGDPSTLTVTITNPNGGIPVTRLGVTDTMPSDMVVFSVPSATTNCNGGTVAAFPGENTFELSGATLGANESCEVSVRVTVLDTGNTINQLNVRNVESQENVSNDQVAQATLNALAAITPAKSFSPASVDGAEISRLTLTITNNQTSTELGESLSNVSITDTLPDKVLVANTPNQTTTCTDGIVTVTPGGSTVQMTGATLAPGTNCQIQVDVLSRDMGTYENSIERGELTAQIQSSIDPMTGGNPTIIQNTSVPRAILEVRTTVKPPEIILVKRITAVNGVNVTGFENGSGTDDDDPHWPTPVSDSLRGALNLTTPVKPGDDLEYSIYFLNTGESDAFGLTLCDRVPDFTTYQRNTYNNQPNQDSGGIAGSGRGMMLGIGASEVSLTNGADGDQGYYFEPNVNPALTLPNINCDASNTNGAVAVQMSSTIPNATAAGVPANSYGYIRFTAKVD